jgi:hypothetical protein
MALGCMYRPCGAVDRCSWTFLDFTAGSYNFAKEIPIFADYEIHISIGGFEEKWVSTPGDVRRFWASTEGHNQMYLVAEFVTYPKRGKSSEKSSAALPKPTTALEAEKSASKNPEVKFPFVNDVLSSSVSSSGVATPTTTSNGQATGTGTMHEQISKRVAQKPREDGSVLHCLAVSTYCFKIGRLTVPPVSCVKLHSSIVLIPTCLNSAWYFPSADMALLSTGTVLRS